MTKKTIEEIEELLKILKNKIEENNLKNENLITNQQRRSLYSEIELLKLDLEDSLNTKRKEEIEKDLLSLSNQFNLRSVSRKNAWWRSLDYIYRFIGLNALFFTSGVFLSLPVIASRILPSKYKIYESLKMFVGKIFVLVSGVDVTVEGLDEKPFDRHPCTIMTFSHASNLDGFMIASTCPVSHYALAKKELFLLPFFSWISLAIGGMPVDRYFIVILFSLSLSFFLCSNLISILFNSFLFFYECSNDRDRAVLALQRSTEAAKSGNLSIVIAPEGTRSTTGQLREFKKGAFHMWEQLKVPIVPFITYGAFELFPKSIFFNL